MEENIGLGDDLIRFISDCFRNNDDESEAVKGSDVDALDGGDGEYSDGATKKKRRVIRPSKAQVKGIRLNVRQKYVQAFSMGALDKITTFIKDHLADDCILTTPAVPEPLVGKEAVKLFWHATISAIPDAVVVYEKLVYNESGSYLKGFYTFNGTKMWHRSADVLFTPKNKSAVDEQDQKWDKDVIDSVLKKPNALAVQSAPLNIEEYSSPMMEYNSAKGIETMYFNEDNKICKLEYEYEFLNPA